jgi:hypothetical protein
MRLLIIFVLLWCICIVSYLAKVVDLGIKKTLFDKKKIQKKCEPATSTATERRESTGSIPSSYARHCCASLLRVTAARHSGTERSQGCQILLGT